MSKFNINNLIKWQQNKRLAWCLSVGGVALASALFLVVDFESAQPSSNKNGVPNMTGGPIDESFTDSNAESALINLQLEAKDSNKTIIYLTKTITDVQNSMKSMQIEHKQELDSLKENLNQQLEKAKQSNSSSAKGHMIRNNQLWHNNQGQINSPYQPSQQSKLLLPMQERQSHTEVEHYKWNYGSTTKKIRYKHNPDNYVPSNTFAQGIVLLGADADASVNGSTSTAPMIFKITSNGSLPNGKESHLKGCRISANVYGDVSSERAYATIQRISCAKPGKPIIDKKVSGWIAFKGKVGIKGKLTMRDDKVLKWAGISGALAGFASVAQASQSVQSISALGSTTTIPSDRVVSAGAFAGGANAMDRLSNYYVKRADQYHPIVQVGAGNDVEVVFKHGFFLEPEDMNKEIIKESQPQGQHHSTNNEFIDPENYSVSESLIQKIDSTHRASLGQKVRG